MPGISYRRVKSYSYPIGSDILCISRSHSWRVFWRCSFFVISEYLIKSIILKSFNNDDFLIKDFYSKRIRRLFPKLIVVNSFSGVRSLIKSSNYANKATRENVIQTNKNLIGVFGGKWTTARQLAKKIAKTIR